MTTDLYTKYRQRAAAAFARRDVPATSDADILAGMNRALNALAFNAAVQRPTRTRASDAAWLDDAATYFQERGGILHWDWDAEEQRYSGFLVTEAGRGMVALVSILTQVEAGN